MDNVEVPVEGQPRPRRRALVWGIAVAAAGAIAAGSFALGRATAPEPPDDTAAACEDARQVVADNMEDASESIPGEDDIRGTREQDEDRAEALSYASVAFNTILPNPDCFDVSERAHAQTFLDTISR
ncbi:hypothetical protein [Streptomyces gobiensis]|uniref:hypothetical protein n=1 Tax=Streptomyces gobiensis TaxID=2875706 RepID=UPI001E5D7C74|nr:hypothetical protein [Streptomyces gobiensis]UGY92772.1 hypothetical protein test1122_14305 [Streptomyces gobiensis]